MSEIAMRHFITERRRPASAFFLIAPCRRSSRNSTPTPFPCVGSLTADVKKSEHRSTNIGLKVLRHAINSERVGGITLRWVRAALE